MRTILFTSVIGPSFSLLAFCDSWSRKYIQSQNSASVCNFLIFALDFDFIASSYLISDLVLHSFFTCARQPSLFCTHHIPFISVTRQFSFSYISFHSYSQLSILDCFVDLCFCRVRSLVLINISDKSKYHVLLLFQHLLLYTYMLRTFLDYMVISQVLSIYENVLKARRTKPCNKQFV